MDEYDLNTDGFTPEQPNTRHEPYRPVSDPNYRGHINQNDDFSRYQPIEPDDDEITSEPSPRQNIRQPKEEPKAHPPQPENTEDAEQKARERRIEREKRIQELKQHKQKADRINPIVRFIKDERTRVFTGILLIFISIFVVIAVFSHFHHGAEDQSVAVNLTLAEMAENPGIVGNAGGGFGAWLSHVLLCDALGLGSLVLIVYLWIIALGLMGIRKCNFWATTFRCLLLAITISVVLGFVTYTAQTVVYWGGNHGHYVNKFLFDNATWIGALGVSLLLIAAVCCVYLNELKIIWNKWQAANRRRKLQEELRRERKRELERLEEEAAAEAAAEAEVDVKEGKDEMVVNFADTLAYGETPAYDTGDTEQEQAQDNEAIGNDTDMQISKEYGDATAYSDDDNLLIIDKDVFGNEPKQENTEEITIDDNFSVVAPEIEEATPTDIRNAIIEAQGLYDHRAELSHYKFPTFDLLEDRPSGHVLDMDEQQANKVLIEKTLLDYRIPISKIDATVGPTVTLYEIVPAEGVRISQIKRLEDDIALSLKALGIRIIAPIPGKGTVGIEVPNNDPQTVSMRSVIASKKYQECKMALPMAMGATISNDIFIVDLAKMPHMLVAGATGTGKSVGLNAILASLLYKKHPSELKLVLIDPKMVEFSLYNRLSKHYLAKLPNDDDAIITDMKKALATLNSLCIEMDNRYELLKDANKRTIEEYNKKFTERQLNPEKGHRYLPYIVVIVDEFADLIMTQGKEVEQPIARIAQKARAVGIHVILATQRPSTNVISGLIKNNFPARIAFRVTQMVDSRTILDCPGANQLIGRGDMLFSHNGSMERVQCAFISTEEVEALTEYIDDQVGYPHEYYLPEYVPDEAEGGVIAGASMERDSLFNEAAHFVVSRQQGSTSSLQRQFGIGYNRAGKLMDQMEAAGIVGPVNGAKPRAILVDIITLESILGE